MDRQPTTAVAPSGIVTFLFTDIEGSTVRWDAFGDAMQQALRRHDAILRAAIESNAGYVFKTIGDAFCAAFERPQDALAAAIDAQLRIAAEDWRAVDGLRVRMSVHAGQTDERSGDYFGPVVNRVARLLSVGHGGQVLVSGYTADLAVEQLPVGAGLRHLGTLPLKDLKEPERVFQLTAPGLMAEFKALRLLETPPNNLPRAATSFVGRDEDLARVKGSLTIAPLVTIAGTGGVGKTRLALQVAADILNDTGEGAWLIDLAPITDGGLIASAILSTLGAHQGADAPPLDLLIEHLEKRRLLLVLDNCEHVVGDVVQIVSKVIARCYQITILATSREALGVSGEHLYRLAPFDVEQAVALFAMRAEAANPRFQLTEGNTPVVESICARLDGIALAIELAAARLRVMSLDNLADHLHERFRVLTGGSRDALPRHQTMRALIDWSYELLTDDEKALLRRMAVFAGAFSLDATSRVCSDDRLDVFNIIDLVESLADKSLIVVSGDESAPRYRLLESIRAYARERVEADDDKTALARRHAEYFSDVACAAYEEFDTDPRPDWLSKLEPEVDDFRAALTWSIADHHDPLLGAELAGNVAPVYLRLSLLREGIDWCQAAIRENAQMPAAVEARLDYTLSMLFNNLAALPDALRAVERSVVCYRGTDDERGLTRALSQLAQQLGRQDRKPEALAPADEAVRRARDLNDGRLLAGVLQRCAMAFEPADIARARGQFGEALVLFRSLGKDDDAVRALLFWATAEAAAGHLAESKALLLEGLPKAQGEMPMYLASEIAGAAVALGDSDAVMRCHEALRLAAQKNHPALVSLAIFYAASLATESNPSIAATLLGYADGCLSNASFKYTNIDSRIRERAQRVLASSLGDVELERRIKLGAATNAGDAIGVTLSVLSLLASNDPAGQRAAPIG